MMTTWQIAPSAAAIRSNCLWILRLLLRLLLLHRNFVPIMPKVSSEEPLSTAMNQALLATRFSCCQIGSMQALIRQYKHLHSLHSVLNTTACLITRRRRFNDIITTLCHDLRWLPVWHASSLNYAHWWEGFYGFLLHRRICQTCRRVSVSSAVSHRHLHSTVPCDVITSRTWLQYDMDHMIILFWVLPPDILF